MNGMSPRALIAATDHTPAAELAVEWAAAEAAGRRIPLRLVRCRLALTSTRFDPDGDAAEQDRQYLLRKIERDEAVIRHRHPGIEITSELLDGDPEAALVEAAHTAEALVVGTRGRGPVPSMLLGSVSSSVAARAACPVIIVRPVDVAARGVVVGVTPSQNSTALLDYAFSFASAHHTSLRAVLCAHRDLETPAHDSYAHLVADQMLAAVEHELAPWRSKYPDVAAAAAVDVDHRIDALVAESASATLLVVGRRAHRSTIVALLGSVSQRTLHHARCPVAVIPLPD
jgi:nucleotide-binding universal stress UspA family protein